MFKLSLGALGALGIVASAAQAQTIQQPVLPQSDVNCDFQAQPSANPAYCGGTVDGTRTGVLTAPPTTAGGRTIAIYRVDFAGNLQIDGVRLQGTNFDATIITDPDAVRINLNTQYLGTLNVAAAQFNPARLPTYFSDYQTQSLVINSIAVDLRNASSTDAATGEDYTFNLRSVDPTNIVNNSTALVGNYRGDDDTASAIVFGRLSGTASVRQNGVVSPSPIGETGGYFSPFGAAFNIVAQETTRLDENGLTTPRIAVTDGINMNGSRVSNLGDGVAAGDAVNRGQLDAEAATRAAADVTLAAQIATEATARDAADVALGSRIDGESQVRAAADVALNARVDGEAQTRASADVALGGRIDAEAATRSAAVAQVAQNVVLERDQRIAADSALGTALSNEMSARMAADVGLANSIGALRGEVSNLSFRLEQIDRRASAGTAVAVAMGGGVFLPGKAFNVTMNVATYDGAHAGSLQVGMLVSSNVAVNGGVATGFNRSGKTAGRAGVSFGF